MKLISRTNIYKGPDTREEIFKLSKKLDKLGWLTRIYDPEKPHSYGPPLSSLSIDIWGLNEALSDENTKCYSINLGTIKPGRIETRDRDKKLEDFLANYKFENMKRVNEK